MSGVSSAVVFDGGVGGFSLKNAKPIKVKIVPMIACQNSDKYTSWRAYETNKGLLSSGVTKKDGKIYPIATPSGYDAVATVIAITLSF